MPTIRLTEKSLARLALTLRGYIEYYDSKLVGFGVRCGPKGKSFFVSARIKGQVKRIKLNLGKVGLVEFEDARAKAESILVDAENGISPEDRRQEKRRSSMAATARNLTVSQILDEYCQTKKKLKQSSKDSYLETLTRYVPDWLELPIRDITADMVVRRHAEAGKKSPANADYTMRIMRALCNHVIETYEDIMVKNPVKRLSTLDAWYKVRRKSSYIAPSDLRLWVPAMLDRSDDGRDYYLGLLFTGARYDELISIRWRDINLEDGMVILRETKSGNPLQVPLCGYYLAMLRARKALLCGRPDDYVFPSQSGWQFAGLR